MSPNPLAEFLAAVHAIHLSGAGTVETSFYTPLNNLLDRLGGQLKPKVRCVMQLKNQGAGLPDGGLFTQEQFDRKTSQPKDVGQPARGVVEVKGVAENMDALANSAQVQKYLERYHLVLTTNLREWRLLGERGELERHVLAASAAEFWAMAAQPLRAEREHGQPFADFLRRAMIYNAPLADPKDLAWLLASYAREARHRVEHASDLAGKQLAALKTSLENALGVSFEAQDGEHFFRSTLVQTLFYGVFAAWVLRHQQGEIGAFDWRKAAYDLHVPMISALFEQLSQPSKLKALNLVDILDRVAEALNRVDRAAFFQRFAAEDSVQYFYEPFLEAFDPELRKKLGVWYTPREIVRYQVARVDWALRTELNLADGLADERVIVLDPCCGTGAYLVEVLRLVGERLRERDGAALAGQSLKQAALSRLFGFELLPAPYVVAHLQLGLWLHRLKAPLKTLADGREERVGVYLTNALTGWTPTKEPKNLVLPFPEFAEERDRANEIKRDKRILVILGNPPYDGFAGLAVGEERDLSDAYRQAERGPQPQGQGLNELYVRFFRMAERQIAECSGQGVVCFISNYSWLDGLSHPAMRERFLRVFDRIWLDNLHGDKYRTGKLTPEGDPDPSAFSTEHNREGIQVGTAIATLVRRGPKAGPAEIGMREWWGKTKRQAILEAVENLDELAYSPLEPQEVLGFAFSVQKTADEYLTWPKLPELFPVSFPGIKTSRDAALVDIDRDKLESRMRLYFDPKVTDTAIAAEIPDLMEETSGFDPKTIRQTLLKKGFKSGKILRFCYRPFDVRWLYWHAETKLLDRNRSEYCVQAFEGNLFIESRQRQTQNNFDRGCLVRVVADNFGNGLSVFFPLLIRETFQDLLGDHSEDRPNLSKTAAAYLAKLEEGRCEFIRTPTVDRANEFAPTRQSASDLFFHSLAVLHSPAYREANAGALRQDWPRIPLPADLDRLRASATLGREVAALLDTETPVTGVTVGNIRPELKALAEFCRTDGEPAADTDFALTAGWGHAGKEGVTMPGRGRVETRAAAPDAPFGPTTLDIYLNPHARWQNVPPAVWEYTLGGYQVLKKWLSYREQSVLGRALRLDEVKEFTAIVRRIAALVLLRERLDNQYRAGRGCE